MKLNSHNSVMTFSTDTTLKLLHSYLKEVRKHSFFKYTWVGALFTVLNIFLLWLFIDVLNVSTIIASTIIVGGLFILKYIFYKLIGLISG